MSAHERLQAVRGELKATLIDRDEVVDGLLVALIARQHVLLLGPPGSAKSMLARELTRRLQGARLFDWLLTKFTTPEELFGPPSLPALEAGRYERVTTDKLPEAEVAFLDEVFKANSAILNALLAVLSERTYHQGSQPIAVPLETLLGASNELPEEDELAALYDRFLLRFVVGYVAQDAHAKRLLLSPPPSEPKAHFQPGDLDLLREQAERVTVGEGVIDDLVELRRNLLAGGVVASDRRWRQCVDVLRATAVLAGRSEVVPGDLRVLEHVLWSDPEELPRVREALEQIAGSGEEELRKLLFQAEEISGYAKRSWPDEESRARALIEAHAKLDELRRRCDRLLLETRRRGRNTVSLEEAKTRLASMQAGLLGTLN